jgi:Fe-S cluster assembly ATPase SufC
MEFSSMKVKNISKIKSNINSKSFVNGFIDGYMRHGFAGLPKKEIDLLVLQLLLQHVEQWSMDDPPSAFELAQVLLVKKGRILSMLDELSYRRNSIQENLEKVLDRLKLILINGEIIKNGNKVIIQIEDGYLREYASFD